MKHTEIIQALIDKNKYTSYLEIGCASDYNFSRILCNDKTGVDPERGGTHRMTSNEFWFRALVDKMKFDLIFIDGLHHSDQVLIDIMMALLCLSEGGTIVVHDLLPTTEAMQAVPRIAKEWTGDGWKAWFALSSWKSLKMEVVDTDYGVGIISGTGTQGAEFSVSFMVDDLNFDFFQANKSWRMNIISVDQFIKEHLSND